MKLGRFMLGAATGFAAGYTLVRGFDMIRELHRASITTNTDSARYGRTRRAFAVSSVARSLASTMAFAYGPAGAYADRIASRGPAWLAPALFAAGSSLVSAAADLPIQFVEGFCVERRYGLTEQSARDWCVDYAKETLLAIALASSVAAGAAPVLRRAPRSWPWIVSGAALPLLIVANLVVPLWVLPLFNTFTPLDGPLEERLRALAARYGVGDAEILRMNMSRQTKKANAFVVGLGSTHRIVLGDTLIDHFTPEEIEFVVAHELGHYVTRDTWRLIGASHAFLSLLLFIAAAPLRGTQRTRTPLDLARIGATLSIGTQILRPVLFAFTRSREWAADRFAVEATGDPASGAAAFRRLRDQNRAEEDVPAWYHVLFDSHPTLGARIDALEHR